VARSSTVERDNLETNLTEVTVCLRAAESINLGGEPRQFVVLSPRLGKAANQPAVPALPSFPMAFQLSTYSVCLPGHEFIHFPVVMHVTICYSHITATR
jgi:hypothetical protein